MADRSRLLLLDDRAVAAAVRAAVARVHGDYGAAMCSIRFSGEKAVTFGLKFFIKATFHVSTLGLGFPVVKARLKSSNRTVRKFRFS